MVPHPQHPTPCHSPPLAAALSVPPAHVVAEESDPFGSQFIRDAPPSTSRPPSRSDRHTLPCTHAQCRHTPPCRHTLPCPINRPHTTRVFLPVRNAPPSTSKPPTRPDRHTTPCKLTPPCRHTPPCPIDPPPSAPLARVTTSSPRAPDHRPVALRPRHILCKTRVLRSSSRARPHPTRVCRPIVRVIYTLRVSPLRARAPHSAPVFQAGARAPLSDRVLGLSDRAQKLRP